MKPSARQLVDRQRLDEALLYKALRAFFPRKNDYYQSETGYKEELEELIFFGIVTVKDLRILLKRHRRRVMEIDKSPMNKWHQEFYRRELGADAFNDFMRRQYWFAYPGLLRLVLELEFGERYEEYSDVRDGIIVKS